MDARAWAFESGRVEVVLATGKRAAVYPLRKGAQSVVDVRRTGFVRTPGTGAHANEFVPFRVRNLGGGNTFAFHVDRFLGFHRVPPARMRYVSFEEVGRALERSVTDATAIADGELATGQTEAGAAGAGGAFGGGGELLAGAERSTPATRRRHRLMQHLRAEYAYNATHMLTELVADLPRALLPAPGLGQSPLAAVEGAAASTNFWRFVRDVGRYDLDRLLNPPLYAHAPRRAKNFLADEPRGRRARERRRREEEKAAAQGLLYEEWWQRRALDLVDLQVFDHLVGNDNRMSANVLHVDDQAKFLVAANNSAAGCQQTHNPPIQPVPSAWRSPHLFLGVLGCRFRKRTVERLIRLKGANATLSEAVRARVQADPVYVANARVLAQGHLRTSGSTADFTHNAELDHNLGGLVAHLQACLQEFGGENVVLDL